MACGNFSLFLRLYVALLYTSQVFTRSKRFQSFSVTTKTNTNPNQPEHNLFQIKVTNLFPLFVTPFQCPVLGKAMDQPINSLIIHYLEKYKLITDKQISIHKLLEALVLQTSWEYRSLHLKSLRHSTL